MVIELSIRNLSRLSESPASKVANLQWAAAPSPQMPQSFDWLQDVRSDGYVI